jgi:nitrogen fixation protein FixH
MQNKNLLIALVIGAIIVLGLGWKVLSGSGASAGSGSEMVALTTDPNPLQTGPATFIIDVKDKTGKPVDNATVFFDLNMTSMNMGTQQGTASPQGNGRYAASGRMSMRGPWRVTTKVTMPDGSIVNKNFTVNVP